MAVIADMVPRVRSALSVDASYEDEIIPYGIQRTLTRLLRDYHFPWAVQKQTFTSLTNGQQDYILPVGVKKELLVQFYDTNDKTYSEPLLKREGFTLPADDNIPRYYWLWNGKLSTDIMLPADSYGTTNLILWYESSSWEANEEWMVDRFEDLIFTYATFRLASEINKPELAQMYGQLWGDDRGALAIYLNELEFGNGIYMQREARNPVNTARYPA